MFWSQKLKIILVSFTNWLYIYVKCVYTLQLACAASSICVWNWTTYTIMPLATILVYLWLLWGWLAYTCSVVRNFTKLSCIVHYSALRSIQTIESVGPDENPIECADLFLLALRITLNLSMNSIFHSSRVCSILSLDKPMTSQITSQLRLCPCQVVLLRNIQSGFNIKRDK